MGRGDKKTKKGKRFAGSYGRVRMRKEKNDKYFENPKSKKSPKSPKKQNVQKVQIVQNVKKQ